MPKENLVSSITGKAVLIHYRNKTLQFSYRHILFNRRLPLSVCTRDFQPQRSALNARWAAAHTMVEAELLRCPKGEAHSEGETFTNLHWQCTPEYDWTQ